ncbi:hypothetical protein AM2_0545 [Lactococcus cremoris]|uniref:Uncharacterized protein n=1 Tax=Lactococcus lactis subsp. cremoris (strain MG1363) TaxID=416870 RepID=A2RMT5_LACLM|nr:hypothetical protein V4_1429 [Lactococcus cremoris]MDU4517367.1 hypothetical protein [Lactococcus lactis]CAL98621.1 hypothetical protein predicted by Glimmer/Critica [Lactococcus cremoris subsp. cremoris MG1363]KZK13686.1 hypothetical protein AB995_0433 [Lactococcus cremoris]KZK40068.1 hypothetical protein N41_0778 [Lactococcus cremoris]
MVPPSFFLSVKLTDRNSNRVTCDTLKLTLSSVQDFSNLIRDKKICQ